VKRLRVRGSGSGFRICCLMSSAVKVLESFGFKPQRLGHVVQGRGLRFRV
jgi:hypothetical protein